MSRKSRAFERTWIPVLATALSLCLATSAQAQEAYALRDLEGSVEIARGDPPQWRAVRPGEILRPGDALRTGVRSRAEVVWQGRSVRLYESSLLRLPADPETVKLERGRSLIDVMRSMGGAPMPFRVETAEIVAAVKGTRFSVSAEPDDDTPLAVYEGEVSVQRVGDTEAFPVRVRQGFALEIGRGRAARLYLHERQDPWEAWSSQGGVAPLFEDRSARREEQARDALRTASDALAPHERERAGPAAAAPDLDPVQDIADPGRVFGGKDTARGATPPPAPPSPPVSPPAPPSPPTTPPPPPPPAADDDD